MELIPCYISLKNKKLESIYTNRNYLRDFGLPLGCSCYDSSIFKCYENNSCPVLKSFSDTTIHFCDYAVTKQDGEKMKVWICAVPIMDENPAKNEPEIILELIINADSIKGCQSQMAAMGQSVAYISHAIKNILEGLHGGGEVIDVGITDGNLVLIEQGWGIVKNNISDISIIAQNILYSSTQKTMKKEKIHPGYIVKKAVDMMKSKAMSKGISLREEVNQELPEVDLDLFSVKRMLLNMILNALEACMRDTKSIPHHVVVRAEMHNESQFKFEIEDNGIGMDEEERGKIFNEFYSTRGTRGTGLGLSVVEKIAEAHQGKIEVESTHGKGSLFRIILNMQS